MRIFTLSQLAREAHVSRGKVHEWIGQGLVALRVGRSWRISERHVLDFMERRQQAKRRVPSRPAAGRLYPE